MRGALKAVLLLLLAFLLHFVLRGGGKTHALPLPRRSVSTLTSLTCPLSPVPCPLSVWHGPWSPRCSVRVHHRPCHPCQFQSVCAPSLVQHLVPIQILPLSMSPVYRLPSGAAGPPPRDETEPRTREQPPLDARPTGNGTSLERAARSVHTISKHSMPSIACTKWNCSCQGMSDNYGTRPGRWHMARRLGKPAMLWWTGQGCSTTPGEAAIAALPALPARPAAAQPLTAAAARAERNPNPALPPLQRPVDCARWNCTCQGMSDRFGTSHGQWRMAAREPAAIQFWNDGGCRTGPDLRYNAAPGSATLHPALLAPPDADGPGCVDLGDWTWAATPGGAAAPLLSEVYDGTRFIGNCGVPPKYTMKPDWKLKLADSAVPGLTGLQVGALKS